MISPTEQFHRGVSSTILSPRTEVGLFCVELKVLIPTRWLTPNQSSNGMGYSTKIGGKVLGRNFWQIFQPQPSYRRDIACASNKYYCDGMAVFWPSCMGIHIFYLQTPHSLLIWHHLSGGTVGYPAHPRLIRLSVSQIRFNYSAENLLIPTIKATIETSWYWDCRLPSPTTINFSGKIKDPINLVLIFQNKHDKSGKNAQDQQIRSIIL